MNKMPKTISLALMALLSCGSILAQGPQQNVSPKAKGQTGIAAPVAGNTPGRIAKFTGSKTVGDSNITEDNEGKIGVGTTLPTSPLTVNGLIETMGENGGIKFPDGTVKVSADVFHDPTLKGTGTGQTPLGLAIPLFVDTGVQFGSIINITNRNVASHGITSTGGADGGIGLRGFGTDAGLPGKGVLGVGGDSATLGGGYGVGGAGGSGDSGPGGVGLSGGGGFTNTGTGGTGMESGGGRALVAGNGGKGVRALGGTGRGTGKSGGHGIEAFAGFGENGAVSGLAGKFNGNVQVTGTLSKAGGSFKIDHPLDPENKYLSHSFVESPDMMNIYNGNITTDANGEAVVELPEWFEALNRDFRYQLTVMGQFAQAIVGEEIRDNRFVIRTSAPGVKVSWLVTGVRQDSWANKNRIPVEEKKSETERGHYLHPEAFDQPEERGVDWANRPDEMREIKKRRLEGAPLHPRN